jgi:hypothetical protein
MLVPDQVRDNGSGIRNPLNLMDPGFRRNDLKSEELTFYENSSIVICHFLKFHPAPWCRFLIRVQNSRVRSHSAFDRIF